MGKKVKGGGKGGAESSKGKGGATPKEESGGKDKLKACNHVKARHILCSKESKILQIYEQLQSEAGSSPSVGSFGKLAEESSECSSGKRGGDLGWFPRGKMVGPFQDVAFGTGKGQMSAPFKTTHGYHIVLVEDRKA